MHTASATHTRSVPHGPGAATPTILPAIVQDPTARHGGPRGEHHAERSDGATIVGVKQHRELRIRGRNAAPQPGQRHVSRMGVSLARWWWTARSWLAGHVVMFRPPRHGRRDRRTGRSHPKLVPQDGERLRRLVHEGLLLPSATQIMRSASSETTSSATDECDFPPDAVTKPVVSRMRPPPRLSSSALTRDRRRPRMMRTSPSTSWTRSSPSASSTPISNDTCVALAVPSGQVQRRCRRVRREGGVAGPTHSGVIGIEAARSLGRGVHRGPSAASLGVTEIATRLPTIRVLLSIRRSRHAGEDEGPAGGVNPPT